MRKEGKAGREGANSCRITSTSSSLFVPSVFELLGNDFATFRDWSASFERISYSSIQSPLREEAVESGL